VRQRELLAEDARAVVVDYDDPAPIQNRTRRCRDLAAETLGVRRKYGALRRNGSTARQDGRNGRGGADGALAAPPVP